MFLSLVSVAVAQRPTVNDENDSCRDRGVTVNVSNSSQSVDVYNNSRTPSDYNMRVNLDNGYSYDYDSRNATAVKTSDDGRDTYKNQPSTNTVWHGKVESVDIKCYDR